MILLLWYVWVFLVWKIFVLLTFFQVASDQVKETILDTAQKLEDVKMADVGGGDLAVSANPTTFNYFDDLDDDFFVGLQPPEVCNEKL